MKILSHYLTTRKPTDSACRHKGPVPVRVLALLCAAALVLLAGCIPSLNPLYTDKDLVFKPELLGTWTENPQDAETWNFQRKEGNVYRLTLADKKEGTCQFDARLVKLGKHLFMDLFPDRSVIDDIKSDDYFKLHFVRTHTFLRVQQIEPTLQLAALDPDWLKHLLKTNATAIAHAVVEAESDDDPKFIITASTAELQKFVLKCADTEGAFAKPSDMSKLALPTAKNR